MQTIQGLEEPFGQRKVHLEPATGSNSASKRPLHDGDDSSSSPDACKLAIALSDETRAALVIGLVGPANLFEGYLGLGLLELDGPSFGRDSYSKPL